MTRVVSLLPVLPLATAILTIAWTGRPGRQRIAASVSAAVQLALAAIAAYGASQGRIVVVDVGGWGPALGIVWVVDALSALMVLLTCLSSLSTLSYAPASFRSARESRFFYPAEQLLTAGVVGACITGDLFNLFVFFELMLIASFALLVMGVRPGQLRAAFPYVGVNLMASALLLVGTGVVYGTAGSVNLAELAVRVRTTELPGAFWAGAGLITMVFGVKSAVAPLFFWLPDSYPEAPLAVSALFGGLLTKIGTYALYRTVPLLLSPRAHDVQSVLLVVSAVTMSVGVLGALGRSTLRGILAFHVVSQVGYIVFGLALLTPIGVAGGLLFLAHNVVVKTALFFAAGWATRLARSGRLGAARGFARTDPWLAVAFLVPALAIAGLPPSSGFWGKLLLVKAGFDASQWALAATSLVVSLLTLASMLKIWTLVFWGRAQVGSRSGARADFGMMAASVGMGAASVAIGLAIGPVFAYVKLAAGQVLDPAPYVNAVLGSQAPL